LFAVEVVGQLVLFPDTVKLKNPPTPTTEVALVIPANVIVFVAPLIVAIV
jgi:hypothetical protein